MMFSYKKGLSLGISLLLALSLAACGKKSSVNYEPLPEEDDTMYHLTMISDADNDYYNSIAKGFEDSLSDLFGQGHYSIDTELTNDTQLIFTVGSDSLSQMSEITSETPIVGTGVMDYQHLLHLTAGVGDKWDKKTGTNITGISAVPNLADQVSLIIESTKDLKSIGLLYAPEDEDALYQLATIEKYLDQAGIPWKEYAVPSTVDTALAASEDTKADTSQDNGTDIEDTLAPITSVITQTEVVAPSVTEGSNDAVDIFGESDLISGIIAPNSAHAPAVSSFWDDSLSDANVDAALPDEASVDEIVTYASRECSALFITTNSNLSDQAKEIAKIATDAGVITISGDALSGEYTLTSAYSDPYAQGYAAGKKAYRILVGGDDPGELSITKSGSQTIKLYNGDLAKELEITFPKSFREINEFKENYVVGSSTKRITPEEE